MIFWTDYIVRYKARSFCFILKYNRLPTRRGVRGSPGGSLTGLPRSSGFYCLNDLLKRYLISSARDFYFVPNICSSLPRGSPTAVTCNWRYLGEKDAKRPI